MEPYALRYNAEFITSTLHGHSLTSMRPVHVGVHSLIDKLSSVASDMDLDSLTEDINKHLYSWGQARHHVYVRPSGNGVGAAT